MSMFYDFGGGVANVNLDKWLAPKYDENLTWKPGDYCVYLGVLKKCTATTTGPFVEASWKDAFLINDGGGGGGSDSFDFIAKEYDPDETYNTGDVVLYNDETQECTADGTTGPWDSSKWKRVYLSDLNSNTSGIDGDLLWSQSLIDNVSDTTISVDCSAYDYFLIETSGNWENFAKSPTYTIVKKDIQSVVTVGYTRSGYYYFKARTVKVTDNSFFYSRAYNGKVTDNDSYGGVPTKLYGLKGDYSKFITY